ncbi:hypothetical protein [Pseudomonas sp. NBRC 111128]|uniref:hypothetical protein n=1 Tax=Pseudomonas sp. NBRC 111128 TaxID=1661043 RepID=UPI0006D48B7E|nr:hypothetical protein [Pseudomonas sp. NBRC 111128]
MPTENRSSNTEMVSLSRDLIDLTLAHLPNDSAAKWEIHEVLARPAPQPHPEPIAWMVGTAIWWTKEEAERDAVATGLPIVGLGPMTGASPADQHQGEPVALPARKSQPTELSDVFVDANNEGWNACLDEIAKLGPLYTHPAPADAGEVEQLRERVDLLEKYETDCLSLVRDAESERDTLRAQLAERDALLRDALSELENGPLTFNRAELRNRLHVVLSASAEPSAPAMQIPEGYCVMPRRLTAENGAKALLLGEFKLEVTRECPECLELEEPTEGCEICDGAGEYGQRYTIPWDKIKFIYSEAVKGLALKQ